MHFSPRRFMCVCVSSIVLFVTYRFTYDRISCVGGRTSAYRVPRKSAPLSSTLFPFRPLSVEGTRKLAFVGAANSKGDVLTLFVEVHAVYDRFVALNYLWMKTPPLSSKLLLLYIIVVSLFGRGWFKKFGFLELLLSYFLCHRCIVNRLFVNVLHALSSLTSLRSEAWILEKLSKTIRLEFRRASLYFNAKRRLWKRKYLR